MADLGQFVAQIFKNQNVDRGTGKPINTSNNVGDAHIGVVDDYGQMVGGKTVGFEKNGIRHVVGAPGNVFIQNKVVESYCFVLWNFETNGTFIKIRVAGGNKFFGSLFIKTEALGLNSRFVVPFEIKYFESGINFFQSVFDLTFLVGILNAQQKLTTGVFCQGVSIGGSTQVTDVNVAGGGGGETSANHRKCCKMILQQKHGDAHGDQLLREKGS